MKVVVVGDVVVDHHVYEGERSNLTASNKRGVRVVREPGGACSLSKLIEQMCRLDQTRVTSQQQAPSDPPESSDRVETVELASSEVVFGLSLPDQNALPCSHHGLAFFQPYPISNDDTDTKVWRAGKLLGYGDDEAQSSNSASEDSAASSVRRDYTPEPASVGRPDVLVLDDAAYCFRKTKNCWMLEAAEHAKWIILKMTSPVCRGELWAELAPYRDRLITIVSADELRPEDFGISRGLSWERTVEDVAAALANDPVIEQLTNCRHLEHFSFYCAM